MEKSSLLKPLTGSESLVRCVECHSTNIVRDYNGEDYCDDCGIVFDTQISNGVDFNPIDCNDESDTFHHEHGIQRSSQPSLLQTKDAKGVSLPDKTVRRLKHLNWVDKVARKRTKKTRLADEFNLHIKPRIYSISNLVTGAEQMMKDCKEMFVGIKNGLDGRKLRHENSLRSRFEPSMKWDIIALALYREYMRSPAPYQEKVRKTPYHYSCHRNSKDVQEFYEAYKELVASGANHYGESLQRIQPSNILNYIPRVLASINSLFRPQNKSEHERYRAMQDSLRLDHLSSMISAISYSTGVEVVEKTILALHSVLIQSPKYPFLNAPNHLLSCHFEVVYHLMRRLAPEKKITRPQIKKMVAECSNLSGSSSKSPQASWGALSKDAVSEVMAYD